MMQLFRPESSLIERQQVGLYARLSPVPVTVVLPYEMVKERLKESQLFGLGLPRGFLCKLLERRDYKLNEIQLFYSDFEETSSRWIIRVFY
jgi:hypothetical protein